jgi:NADH-quinone oxidoreductase subunit C
MTPQEQASRLQEAFGDVIADPVTFRGEVTLVVREADRIADVCRFAKQSLQCHLLLDLSSIDHYGEDPRWTLVYELYSLEHRCHLRLKTSLSEELSELPSVHSIWRTANWHEREVYDMMGIRFRGHPDLRRILMWEGYPDHPLRKDFPLAGKPSDVSEVAFTQTAPMEGGPFVTQPGVQDAAGREPRSRTWES